MRDRIPFVLWTQNWLELAIRQTPGDGASLTQNSKWKFRLKLVACGKGRTLRRSQRRNHENHLMITIDDEPKYQIVTFLQDSIASALAG